WLFNTIDDDHFDRPFARFELQTKLFLDRSEDARQRGFGSRFASTRSIITSKNQIHIKCSGESRLVDDGAAQYVRERSDKTRYRYFPAIDPRQDWPAGTTDLTARKNQPLSWQWRW